MSTNPAPWRLDDRVRALGEGPAARSRGSGGHGRGWATRPAFGRLRGPMFIIELTYKVDLSEIDAHMAAHMTYLRKHYAAGTFVVSGRHIPRKGGVIVALGKTREELEVIVAEDPFHRHALADFRIIEFRASQHAKGLDALFAAEVATTRCKGRSALNRA